LSKLAEPTLEKKNQFNEICDYVEPVEYIEHSTF